jgi:hypothetical protein
MKNICIFSLFFLFPIDHVWAQINGCTDPLATNFNSSATVNDGSCAYNNASISPSSSFILSDSLSETSGLFNWDHKIWTHNDDSDTNIYALDTISGNILQSYTLTGTINNDWEEISPDSNYLYVGDFGNNSNGNRTDLKILRIDKNSILLNGPIIDTINYSYSDQTSFAPADPNNTDFDCEAFFVTSDSIYLLTKQWISNKTSLYSLPKIPGTYIAQLKTTFDIEGLITGAVFLQTNRILALCGYSNLLESFIYLLYDFNGTAYFGGNKRKIKIALPFHQIEGITTTNGLRYYLSNEYFSQPPIINTQQKLHLLDLSSYLGDYLNGLTSTVSPFLLEKKFLFYPNPVNDFITIESKYFPHNYYLINSLGQTVKSGNLISGNTSFSISELSNGLYFLKVGEENTILQKVIKR